ncbi:hypothetical protein ES703_13345 [subsurface metagenome]
MRNTILYTAFSIILGLGGASGQNIALEKQVNACLIFPVADIESDGILEIIGFDPVNDIPALYDGATLQRKYTLPFLDLEALIRSARYNIFGVHQYTVAPFLDLNNDGKKDVLLTSYDNSYNIIGFTVHDIANNSTIYEYVDPDTGSHYSYGWLYLADIDGDNELEIMICLMHYPSIKSLVFSTGIPLSSSQQSMAPMNYQLFQNYPNPFNPSTNIKYSLPKQGHVVINVFNIKGQVVDRLVDKAQGPGHHMTRWNAKQLSSGLYFYQIIVDDKPIATRKAIYLK